MGECTSSAQAKTCLREPNAKLRFFFWPPRSFEFSFIIPASSPPFERSKHGRVRYIVTATALGAGRARQNISAWREVFVILNVDKDGGPTPLEIIYADAHEALGPISLSLTAASLTVGGTAMLTVVHPDPPPKLSVHVIRVFIEQTFEIYSETKKAWLKLPAEKMRLAEWGHMPNKPNRPVPASQQPSTDPADAIWKSEPSGSGKPGKGAFRAMPHVSPYGTAIPHMASAASSASTPGGDARAAAEAATATANAPHQPTAPISIPGTPAAAAAASASSTPNKLGYKLRTTLRLPNDDHMRPSTVKGSRAEIRVGHEMGVEVFFSRLDVLDTREGSETYGRPKVQVFSARRAVVIPSCTATFDTVHLPPYVEESPVNSRPPSPTNLARSPVAAYGRNSTSHTHAELQKLANTLHNTLPGGRGRQPTPPHSKTSSHPNSSHNSQPGSRYGSREPSPTRGVHEAASAATSPTTSTVPHRETPSRSHSGIGHSISAAFGSHFPSGMGMGRKSRPNSRPSSRPASPTHESGPAAVATNGGGGSGSGAAGAAAANAPIAASSAPAVHHPRSRRSGFGGGLHALTPAVATQTFTAPPSGATTPIHGTGAGAGSNAYSPQTHATPSNMIYAATAAPHGNYVPSTPRTLPANSPWGVSHFPHRTGGSHDTCNCGRSTEELAAAEMRLIEGVPTAPGAFSERHADGEMPPPWTQSRAPSPDYFSQVWAGTQTVASTPGIALQTNGGDVGGGGPLPTTAGTKTPFGSP